MGTVVPSAPVSTIALNSTRRSVVRTINVTSQTGSGSVYVVSQGDRSSARLYPSADPAKISSWQCCSRSDEHGQFPESLAHPGRNLDPMCLIGPLRHAGQVLDSRTWAKDLARLLPLRCPPKLGASG
jgi:hypothetical protein